MNKILILAASAAISATTLFSPPAFAQSAPTQLVVGFADLDLSTAHGQRVLDRRLRSAAETVCGPTSSADPRGKNEVRRCRTDTLAYARSQRDIAVAQASAQIQLAAQ